MVQARFFQARRISISGFVVDTHPNFDLSKLKYPYGWGKRKYSSRDLIEQSGQVEGFQAHIAIYPREHIYAVVLSNIQSGFSGRIPRDLEAVLFGGEVSQPPQITTIVLGDRSMRQYIGGYHMADKSHSQTLDIREGHITMRWDSDQFWREMVMIEGDTFFLRAEYARIHFERGTDGLVYRMTWSWPGGTRLTFNKDEISGNPQPTVPGKP
jgi:hypothetical protein